MRVREVRASYGLTVNAGNYNSERIEVSITGELDPDDIDQDVANDLITKARQRVRFHLSRSDNPNVRRFIEAGEKADDDTPF